MEGFKAVCGKHDGNALQDPFESYGPGRLFCRHKYCAPFAEMAEGARLQGRGAFSGRFVYPLPQQAEGVLRQRPQGQIAHPCNHIIAMVHRQQQFPGRALADGPGHGGGDFPQQGIGDGDTHGPGDHIGVPGADDNSVFARGALIRPGPQHGGGGGGVGAYGGDFAGDLGSPDGFH